MLANFLNKSKPINFIGLLVLFFLGYVFTLISTVFKNGFHLDLFLKSIFLSLLFLFIFFFYNFIVSKNKLTKDNSLGFFLFTLLSFSILPTLLDYNILLLMVVNLLFLRKIYSLKSPNRVLEKLFDSGFWLGIFFLLQPSSIVFIFLIYFAIFIHHKITIHSILVPFVGFCTPLLLHFTYFFWIEDTTVFTSLFNFDFNFSAAFYFNKTYYSFTTAILCFTILTIIVKSIGTLTINNTFRRSWVLLLLHFLMTCIYLIFAPEKNGASLLFLFFSVSIILTNGIQLIKKKLFRNIVLYTILFCSIFFYTSL